MKNWDLNFNPLKKFIALSFSVILFGCSSFPKGTKTKIIKFSDKDKVLEGTLYLPTSKKPTAAVIVAHGGAWALRSGGLESVCKKLLVKGIAAFQVTYRLAPEHTYPKQLIDIKDSIQWLKKNGAKYNIDSKKIGGWGYSAGANLILLAGLDPELELTAVVAGGTPAKLDDMSSDPLVENYLGESYKSNKKKWKDASPYYNVRINSPPVFLYHGAYDFLIDFEQMGKMRDALEDKGVKVKTHKVMLSGHVTTYLLSSTPENLGVKFLMESFQ